MKIKVARSAGFCWGVKRAVNLAVDAANRLKHVYCLGELIHNKPEIERLKTFGIDFVDSVKGLPSGETIIIRSHGVPPSMVEEIEKKGLKIVDATCPFVKDVHEKVIELEKKGYPICILGNPYHPEVIGIAGHVKSPIVVSSLDELEEIPRLKKLGIVCQTTLEQSFLKEAVSFLSTKVKELKVYKTFSGATQVRQQEAEKLALEVDLMIVIGGKNSSNTAKLYRISKSVNPKTYHVESKDDIDVGWFENIEVVGITAGASTPQWVIDEVVDFLKTSGKGGKLVGRGVCKVT